MSAYGATARFAIDASLFVAFLDAHSDYQTGGFPRRERHTINGRPVDPTTDARTIRRWRSQGGTVSRRSAIRLLRRCRFRLTDFAAWAEAQGHEPTIRGRI